MPDSIDQSLDLAQKISENHQDINYLSMDSQLPGANQNAKATATPPLEITRPLNPKIKISIIGLGTLSIIIVLVGIWLNHKKLKKILQ